ncbi:hypothetical protein JZ751_022970, partial [Albula glossodonta]
MLEGYRMTGKDHKEAKETGQGHNESCRKERIKEKKEVLLKGKRTEVTENNMEERGQWESKTEFLLVVLGNIVGLGNVWRFPYLCYKYGGGIGYGGVVLQIYGCVNYVIILAWALFYLIFSFSSQLPWATCTNTWNTANCMDIRSLTSNRTQQNKSTSAAVEFWERRVLGISGGIEQVGSIRWELALCLFAMWITCYFCIWKGVKSTGKVVYFTAIFPYVMLLVLLVRGLTLPGALEGIVFYLYPDATRLADPQVWMEAGSQIFYSYSVGAGSLIVMGSYNVYNNNCYRDCWLCLLNSGTSFVAGFAVFSVLGFMAHELGVPIEEVAESGPGLVFIAYPQATAMMPFSQLWAVCFFIMIILLGLDTQFVSVETVTTTVSDLFPVVLRRERCRKIFLLLFCVACFLVELLLITECGMYVFQLIDYYSSGVTLFFMALSESLIVAWVYGAERFYDVIEDMAGVRPNALFKIGWCYITPLASLGSLIFYFVKYEPLTFNHWYVYPDWAYAVGWLMSLSSILLVPFWGILKVCTGRGSIKQ